MGSGNTTSFRNAAGVPRICVIGQGFLGTKIAAELAMSGCIVTTVDTYVTDARARKGIVDAMCDVFSRSIHEDETKWNCLLKQLNLIPQRESVCSSSPTNETGSSSTTTTMTTTNNTQSVEAPAAPRPRDRKIPRIKTATLCEKAIQKLIENVVETRVTFHKSIKDAVSGVQLVVEAVVERLDVKQAVLKEAEENVSSSCVLATNSMTLSLDSIKSVLSRPDMLIGLRFLSPVVGIPFVEIWGDATKQSDAIKYAASIMEGMEKIVFKYEPPERTEENKDISFPRLVLQFHEVRKHRKRAVKQLIRHLEANIAKGEDVSLRWTLGSSLNFVKDKVQMCVVCFERPGTVLILSCGHRILCRQCMLNIQLVNPRCPVCREWIGSTATSLLPSSRNSSSSSKNTESSSTE